MLGHDDPLRRCEQVTLQFVECPVPAFFVAAASFLVVQARMGEGQLSTFGDGAKLDLDERLAGILHPTCPTPAAPVLQLRDICRCLLLAAVEHAEANPVAATDARVGLGQ
jgi:hypothetical protein